MKVNTVIIGGGISGLSTANFLSKKTSDFLILESSNRVGGTINSLEVNGYIIENGPNTVLDNNTAIRELLTDLNITKKLIYPNLKKISNRYILINDRLEKIPLTITEFLFTPILTIFSKIKIIFEVFVPRHLRDTDVESFIKRRFGKEFHDNLIVPFLTGIYADTTSKMSAKNTLKKMWELEQEYGSILIGLIREKNNNSKAKIFTIDGGLSKITELLAKKFINEIKFNTKVSSIVKINGSYKISLNKGEDIICKKIISTIPAYSLKDIVFNHKLKDVLSKVNYNPIDVFHFGFDRNTSKIKVNGFGLLTKPEDEKSFLGILFSSNIFEHVSDKNKFLITVLAGGDRQKDLCNKTPKLLEKQILNEILPLLKLESEPEFKNHFRWSKGIPSYSMKIGGLQKEIEFFEENNKGFYITGNYHLGVSVSDCIKNSMELIETKFK